MSGENENEFSILLTSLREKRKKQRRWGMDWTQQGVAKRLSVSRAMYNYWENGRAIPTRDDLKNIVFVFVLDEIEEAALYRKAAQVPPPIDNLPPRNPFFTGREEHLNLIRDQLQETGSVEITQPVTISGLGGIGKTQLALEYAYSWYPKVYRVALWVIAADSATLERSVANLAEVLRLPERNEHELDRRILAVRNWLTDHTNWLLIMDNADNLELARSFLPGEPLGHVVFTTRSQIIGTTAKRAKRIYVDEMTPEEGLLFLLQRSDILDDDVTEDILDTARHLVTLLGRHPLALDQAGAFIAETDVSLIDYVTLYNEQRRKLLDRRGLKVSEHSKHPKSVVATFELCFSKAREQHPMAMYILSCGVLLQPDAIPEELLQLDDVDVIKIDKFAYLDGLSALRSYSLIKHNTRDKTLSIHRLVQAVLIDAMSAEDQTGWKVYVVLALYLAFPEVGYSKWDRCERLLSHVLACAAWSTDAFTGQYKLAALRFADVLHKAGLYLYEQGRYSDAETLLVRVPSLYEQFFGSKETHTADAMVDLGNLYWSQKKYPQAEALQQQAFAIQEKLLGADHPATLTCLHNLALTNAYQGKYEVAVQLLEKVLAIQEDKLGPEHSDTVRSMHNLATFYITQGKYEQAEWLFRRTISLWEKLLGPQHPLVAQPLSGLAMMLARIGKHEDVDALYQRALSIQKQELGEDHPRTIRTKNKYASFLHSVGRDAEAAALEVNEAPSV